ncbi:MAG TPA: ABC transporter substrate-binding protein [Gammaproteobacteria bacterium]|nr:ABC transporter substrate-binding protein [Gammaproteobacteria bacterium]
MPGIGQIHPARHPRPASGPGRLVLLKLLLVISAISYCAAAAERANIAILFPQVASTHARIYEEIMHGVSEHALTNTSTFAVTAETRPQDISAWLNKTAAQAILVLGQRSFRLVQELDTDMPMVVGAVVAPADSYPTLSLSGDPDMFFSHLKSLAPRVKRVFIVYSEASSGWLVRLAEISARKHGLELVARPAETIREAVLHYRSVLETAHSDSDAIWLPMDRVAPDKTILPMALDAAWKRRLVVFCSNPLYVKRGALFALYPDHRKMGSTLADMALEQIGNITLDGARPTRTLKLAVNQRTASHLGLHYPPDQERTFDLVYPGPR